MDRCDNGERCALLTYKIGQKINYFIARSTFLGDTMIWKVVGLVFDAGAVRIADLVVSLERARPK